MINAVKYLPKNISFNVYYNLNDSSKNSVLTNVGEIPVEPEPVPVGTVIITGTIIDLTNVVPAISGAVVTVNSVPSVGIQLVTTTGLNGKYSVEISLPLN